jgi:RNA polymerase sigma factor (sigma-70 family)
VTSSPLRDDPLRAPARTPRPRAGARSPFDQAALVAFSQHDPEAVRALYLQYGRLVYAVAYRVLGRRDLAEDASQQTFLRAWQAADRIDVDRDPAAWLATIAKRAAIDIARREARRPASAIDDVSPHDRAVVSLPPELGTLDAVWRVRRAIDELAPDEAAIVRLQHLDGMTHAEVAEKLGVPLGTVKSRSHRAHQKLAELLGHLREPIA